MWYSEERRVDWAEAERVLSRGDPVMRKLIKRVGPCTLGPRRDYFVKLCQSIFAQQLSTVVATVLFNRFRDQFPGRRPTPAKVVEFIDTAGDERIRSVGLSRQKRVYVRDLAAHFADGRVNTRRLARMEDEEIVQALVPIKGIGRWTVEMFLIFCLNRTDVWPVDDLGVRKGAEREYGLGEMPTKKELWEMGERWRPWRTVVAWYLWRGGDGEEKRKTKSA